MRKVLYVSQSGPNRVQEMYQALTLMPDVDADILYFYDRMPDYHERKKKYLAKLFSKLGLPLDESGQNKRLIERCRKERFDYVIFLKGNNIRPRTLKKLKKVCPDTKLINWSPDNMFQKHNRSLYYKWSVPYYDLLSTSKVVNLEPNELPSLGAKHLIFQFQGYLPGHNEPVENCELVQAKHDVVFIGVAEKARFESMNYLAQNGIEVYVYGARWEEAYYQQNAHPNLKLINKALNGRDYVTCLSCSKISLCFLRRINCDLHTKRTFEIPASGGFMLAERTGEHLQLFEEGREAEYFSSDEELLEKVRYYLQHENERAAIARNGRRRCEESPYSYVDKCQELFDFFENPEKLNVTPTVKAYS